MWLGLFTSTIGVVSPRHVGVMVAAAPEGAIVNIQTLGTSCEGILTSEDFLICKEHQAEMVAVLLTYRVVMQDGGFASG